MRRIVSLAALAALALFPAQAVAKEVGKVEVCGAAGACAKVADTADRMQATGAGWLKQDPPAAAPWYEITVTMKPVAGEKSAPPGWSYQWVPSAGLVRVFGEADFEWHRVDAAAVPVLRRTVRGLTPRPASTLPGPLARPAPASPSPVRDGGDGTPWTWIVVAAGAALAAAAVVSITRRHFPAT